MTVQGGSQGQPTLKGEYVIFFMSLLWSTRMTVQGGSQGQPTLKGEYVIFFMSYPDHRSRGLM